MYRKWILLPVVSTAILLFAGAIACLLAPRLRARAILSQMRQLKVGESTLADARTIAAKTGAISSDQCSPSDCLWHLQVTNWRIPELWRGKVAVFSAGFEVHDSIVVEKGFSFQVDTGPSVPYVNVEERIHWRGSTTEPVFVSTKFTAREPYYQANVKLTSAAPEDIRKRYLSFNLNCLSKYGGCKDAQDLLPTIEWK